MDNKKRFKTGLDNPEGALKYYHSRACQLLPFGWSWNGNHELYPWGVSVLFEYKKDFYSSVFIFKNSRNQGHLTNWYSKSPESRFFTLDECGIEDKLISLGVEYILADHFFSEEHSKLRSVADNHFDEKSSDFAMNSVDRIIYAQKVLLKANKDTEKFFLAIQNAIQNQELDFEKISDQMPSFISAYRSVLGTPYNEEEYQLKRFIRKNTGGNEWNFQ